MFVSAIFFGNVYKQPRCVCLLSEVITDALNFELLTNICCAIDTIKYISHIRNCECTLHLYLPVSNVLKFNSLLFSLCSIKQSSKGGLP